MRGIVKSSDKPFTEVAKKLLGKKESGVGDASGSNTCPKEVKFKLSFASNAERFTRVRAFTGIEIATEEAANHIAIANFE